MTVYTHLDLVGSNPLEVYIYLPIRLLRGTHALNRSPQTRACDVPPVGGPDIPLPLPHTPSLTGLEPAIRSNWLSSVMAPFESIQYAFTVSNRGCKCTQTGVLQTQVANSAPEPPTRPLLGGSEEPLDEELPPGWVAFRIRGWRR